MAVVLLTLFRISAPRETVYLENSVVNAPILQDGLRCSVVAALIVRHAEP